MEYNEAVQAVVDELRTNRNGAYGLAVRLAANNGGNAERLMADAVALAGKAPAAPSGRPVLNNAVEFPSAEAMGQQLMEKAEGMGGLGPDTLVLVPLLMALLVEERERIKKMVGSI